MGIEILLGVLVFPVAQKVGEKWIDRIATGIDGYSVQLLKQVVSDPAKEQEVKDYIQDNPEVARKLEQNILDTMQSPDTVASLRATVVPPRGEILKYYAELIRWIVRSGSRLGRNFVLKGFLNGELHLSYFIIDRDRVDNSGIVYEVGDSNLTFSSDLGVDIYVERLDTTETRDEKFKMLNDAALDDSFGWLRFEDYGKLPQIEKIYERYVVYTNTFKKTYAKSGVALTTENFRDLPIEKQGELRIATFSPIPIMIESLGEQFEDRIETVKNLQKAIEAAM
jgi:hypothetical protein